MIIYKYPLDLTHSQLIKIPKGQVILDIDFQNTKLMLWAIVDPSNELEDVNIKIVGTGHEFQYHYGMQHIKTIHDSINGFVWHIFVDNK